ncbi:MAG: tetratricopeptide repeat protein [Bacteroidales bacterium]|nr:tetratricopeptide repeat protein [Bacteroidales bacterium]
MRKLLMALLVLLLMQAGAAAQDWEQVGTLYRAGMYREVLRLLDGQDGQNAFAWKTLCALQMRTDNAPKMARAFLTGNPESPLAPQVRYRLAQNFFDDGEYALALEQLDLLDAKSLYGTQLAEYTYKTGYCAYEAGDWDRAKELLGKVVDLPYSTYTAPACYSLGYMEYAQERFDQAQPWFEKAAKDSRFTSVANYYVLECRFNEKDYQYVIEHGGELYNSVPEDRKAHLARILGESYLVLGKPELAGEYYLKHMSENPSRSDLFYAGQINYQLENWQAAVDNFTRMEDRTDSLGQVASYQLGYSYIRLKNKVDAQDAFKQASDLTWSAPITEDAFFNYAKLAFDLGRNTAPFKEYLSQWGTKEKGDQIYSYMAMAALQEHDYERAVDAYDHIDDLDPRMKSNYMKAYFLRARELMEAGSWRAAAVRLKAAAYFSDRRDPFNQLSRYYLSEALYRDGKYDEARTTLTELYNMQALAFSPEGRLLPYQLGYTYFKEADYAKAQKWFSTYLNSPNPSQGADAAVRLADCHFFSGSYSQAVKAYERQMADYPDANNLYPRLRAGVASGLIGDEKGKQRILEPALLASPEAPFYGESLYELGRSYVATKNNKSAVKTFSVLQSTSKDPSLVSRSLLELGMIARNEGRSDDALDCYKQVVAGGGEYAEDALLAIEAIYRTREDPDAYLAYVNGLGGSMKRTEGQKEEVYFSSAEQLYLSGDYTKAQATLQAYLEKYPKATYGAKARFYLAECYRFGGNREMAADYYRQAIDQGLEGALAESATLQYASLNEALGSYGKAYRAYLRLEDIAVLEPNRLAARVGLMRTAYRSREWDDALAAARVVLSQKDLADAVRREAKYVSAKSLLATGRRSEALPLLEQLSAQASTDEGAESAYLLIQDRYDRADFGSVQDKVYAFAEKAGGQNYWLAKAFIVLGDCFVEQGQVNQARATFESIRNGYTSTGAQDDVLDQVELRLSKL